MSEANMRATLVKNLSGLHAVAIESPMTGIGIPDVNCTAGWIECKEVSRWPKKDTPVRLHHPLTKEQGIWLMKREKAGGLAYVMVKVSQEWFLFSVSTARAKLGELTRSEMSSESLLHMSRGFQTARMTEFLISRMQSGC